MQLQLTQIETRSELFEKVGNYLAALKLKVATKDFDRPWGGFYVLDESQAQQFAKLLSGLNEWDQSLAFCLRMIFSENRFPLFGIMR